MVFASAIFLFAFFPITLAGYYFINPKYRNTWLCVMSFVFYAWGGLGAACLILLSTVVNYSLGIWMDKLQNSGPKKIVLTISVIYNLGILVFFKYFNFIVEIIQGMLEGIGVLIDINAPAIALPIGISFFTFQIMSYIIDLYKEQIKVQKNIINLGLYIMLFPQLIAGPIVRYIDVEKEISNRTVTVLEVKTGLKRFILGLAKKMVLANTMGELADVMFNYSGNVGCVSAWVGIICYTFQIFYDFSAYSDMAIGLGEIFGFHFLENFNYPYTALSMQDFWRRWHMSLTKWFRDYLYIPLGGNRKGRARTLINNVVVFFFTGLWHGASWNYIFWGLYHGVFMLCEKRWNCLGKVPNVLRRIYVLLVVMIGWVFFRADNISLAVQYIRELFSFNLYNCRFLLLQINNWYIAAFMLAIIFSAPISKKIAVNCKTRLKGGIYEILSDGIYIVLFLISICFISGGRFNPFIYFKF